MTTEEGPERPQVILLRAPLGCPETPSLWGHCERGGSRESLRKGNPVTKGKCLWNCLLFGLETSLRDGNLNSDRKKQLPFHKYRSPASQVHDAAACLFCFQQNF